MSKILFVSNITQKISSFVTASISAAHEVGLDFYHASNWQSAADGQIQADEAEYNVKISNIPISRNPVALSNWKAYRALVKLIQRENIDFIHCNTPTGGLIGRLAGRKCGVKKVIYQAHGFHFYKGAPKKNWLIYYPIEKWLARYTDALITINQEDYALAKTKFKLRKGGKVYYVPGVGIDTAQYTIEKGARQKKREELGISLNAFVIVSVGELNANKNSGVLISAIEQLGRSDVHYVLCGVGEQESMLRRQADEAGLKDNVHFLGYREDVKELYQAADCFVMSSLREGLSRSIMEAMASGLPCVVSKIRGNTDLVVEGKGGFLCKSTDSNGFAAAIATLLEEPQLREKMGCFNKMQIREYDSSVVEREMRDIYSVL